MASLFVAQTSPPRVPRRETVKLEGPLKALLRRQHQTSATRLSWLYARVVDLFELVSSAVLCYSKRDVPREDLLFFNVAVRQRVPRHLAISQRLSRVLPICAKPSRLFGLVA
jgi:hypothetical protein